MIRRAPSPGYDASAMRILIDEAVWQARALFSDLGEVRTFSGRALSPDDLRAADALIVRSVTRVDAALLAGSPVRFVGTVTSGADHIDTALLAERDIRFADAAGTNSRPVAEYVLAAILLLCERAAVIPASRTLGVVGVGRIGSIVREWAAALGMSVLACDPPLAASGRPGLVDLSALASADILTFHVPLTDTGPYATRGMLDHAFLARLRPGTILINTARGEILRPPALLASLPGLSLGPAVVDVWPGEPRVDPACVRAAAVATPHVAGYTAEAKERAAVLIREKLAAWLGRPVRPPPVRPPSDAGDITVSPAKKAWPAAAEVLCRATGILDVDRRFRASLAAEDPAAAFDALRAACARRREFAAFRVRGLDAGDPAAVWLSSVGFRLG